MSKMQLGPRRLLEFIKIGIQGGNYDEAIDVIDEALAQLDPETVFIQESESNYVSAQAGAKILGARAGDLAVEVERLTAALSLSTQAREAAEASRDEARRQVVAKDAQLTAARAQVQALAHEVSKTLPAVASVPRMKVTGKEIAIELRQLHTRLSAIYVALGGTETP